uniref:Activator of Hsp90 ATPase AHSA1-like N-terminal domain-containing protein n=1 Tax=Chromera velia CCMP2878 TaxID=1169474 RepID=A0A0G4GQ64_9ALVE|mmetsp:Transcript_51519/g.101125  ORF Transcript_51519/g.101125 Transcript_51519/m.101125 type:complete len:386 (+) Transcript_51519:194-1351(+)|eukprot:Cvel_22838.t1-p1 / transcript=Cvel_22838.t1 / gene=Cvel_22838 / organism=Chromera_velia_CCMP2878 / gene_product=Activator of 90 kDa heat shock protein ATPase, putative / transcript_product=Activator of 90 kDa heat shock protein ATPase, putative / location=Cvel_scaffold2288:10316-14365(+) / protein_length=385 / sequence_SO=supercontig / SO=protein_coding / is_pseudo=false
MATDASAAGSVWNKNSWHWEEKNYTKLAISLLNSLLADFTITASDEEPSLKFSFKDVEAKGEASVSVRKGKRIVAFEFAVGMQWEAQSESSNETATGRLNIGDFAVDSVADQDYEVSLTLLSGGALGERAKEFLRKEGVKAMKKHLACFTEKLSSQESDQERLAADKKRREEEAERMRRAEEEKGEEKKKFLEEQKRKEQQKREADAEMMKRQMETAGQVAGQGSVWNANSYHWEEKPQSTWARERLLQIIENAKLSLQPPSSPSSADSSFELSLLGPVKVEGEASTSIRKGRKICVFDMKVSCGWAMFERDGTGMVVNECKGSLEVENFTSEDEEDEWAVKAIPDPQFASHKHAEPLIAILKKAGVSAIRGKLKSFVEELKQRG